MGIFTFCEFHLYQFSSLLLYYDDNGEKIKKGKKKQKKTPSCCHDYTYGTSSRGYAGGIYVGFNCREFHEFHLLVGLYP